MWEYTLTTFVKFNPNWQILFLCNKYLSQTSESDETNLFVHSKNNIFNNINVLFVYLNSKMVAICIYHIDNNIDILYKWLSCPCMGTKTVCLGLTVTQ